jgi:hypothetical protein
LGVADPYCEGYAIHEDLVQRFRERFGVENSTQAIVDR